MTLMEDKMREVRLRWFWDVMRKVFARSLEQDGSNRWLEPLDSSMALEGTLLGIWEVLEVADNLWNIESGSSKGLTANMVNHRTRRTGMEFDSDLAKHRKSFTITSLVITSAESFIPWSSMIAISEGYHELL
ncbi:hypothetical protein FXO38_12347 [Capsicum annuum]|uniref:Uncharacterized protein n=1 Tax=Capsicum annuum TaxID=4072 RepID=A0A2G2ZI62_CAPAN|nr:hypothetical protein FXO38_12347 [Capsicum annuum]KAF3670075.1 hypothetical protein FXO37_08710 [Capsicum annuum]PHT81680.1 hypothetical protein T459_14695 [Capsicum annuum]